MRQFRVISPCGLLITGAGNCDMETIRCNCTEGFTGGACELKVCQRKVTIGVG